MNLVKQREPMRPVDLLCSLALSVSPPAGACEAPPWQSIIPADVPATRHDLLDYRYAASSPLCPRCEATEGNLAFRFKQGTMTAVEPTQVSIGD